MSGLWAMFAVTNTCKGAKSSLVNCYAAFLLSFHILSIPEMVSLLNVNGSQSVWPFMGVGRIGVNGTVLFWLITKVGIYINRITTNKMRPTNNGLPTGEPNLHNAELRQLLKGYLKEVNGLESFKDDIFQLMECLVASMETLGIDSGTALYYFSVCRSTVDFITDLEYILLQSSKTSQSCSN
jgi:hypothetical protein